WQSLISYDHDPFITVSGHGYGLVQWTFFNKYTIWANDRGLDYWEMDSQLQRILYEVDNNIQWLNSGDPKGRSFYEFTQSEDSPYDLAMVFISAYERPADPNQPNRGTQAEHWFNVLDGEGGVNPDPDPDPDPHEPVDNDIIKLLLADTLNGWKY